MKIGDLMEFRRSLPPSRLPGSRAHPRRSARWLQRRIHRYQPLAILSAAGAIVLIPLILDLFVPPAQHWMDSQAAGHEVGVNLLEHLVVAALVAAVAFYLVLGRKRQKALNSYRSLAKSEPWELVDWSQRRVPVTRRTTSDLLAEGIDRSPQPAIAIVEGGAGTGRTSFIVGLVRDLAERGLIPIPVLAPRDGSLEFEDLASKKFCRHIDLVLNSDREADEIWHRARSTRDVVILVDGLDDELVSTLWQDEDRFQAALESMHKQRIAVVLSTTRELPIGAIPPLREDLDLFSGEEAERFLRKELDGEAALEAIAALRRLPDPVDGSLIAPFYLELLVGLQSAGILAVDLPAHRDRWRAAVLKAYLEGIRQGLIASHSGGADPDGPDAAARGEAAIRAARSVARKLRPNRVDLTVPLKQAKIGPSALRDAGELNLLAHGAQRVGFAADDLGSYLVASTVDDVAVLLETVQVVASRTGLRRRLDRHVLNALIFWHLQHEGEQRVVTFEQLLTDLETNSWTRPAVVAAVVRIASACEITTQSARVAASAYRCIGSFDTVEETALDPGRSTELLRLVRALSEWQDPAAHQLLWRLATNADIEVEWPAAKALAMAKGGPEASLRKDIEDIIKRAEASTPEKMSKPGSALGNEIASLAWILPAIRDMDDLAETQLSRVEQICLDPQMSPLRGEMSLVQGLKFAIVNGKAATKNVATAYKLLVGHAGGMRFWHARLVLVQAILAYAWQQTEDLSGWQTQLKALGSREPHRLVKRGIDLAQKGLRERRSPFNDDGRLSTYMWIHEREAVRWVDQGKAEITQLAADSVLLSNMTYRLRKTDPHKADDVAAELGLPDCIRRSSKRRNITTGCSCRHKLCERPGEPAVVATRAPFSESFCREQARLARLRLPPWMARRIPSYRGKKRLEEFWAEQAMIAQRGGALAEPTTDSLGGSSEL